MEIEYGETDIHRDLKSIFDDTGDEDAEFLGFSDSSIPSNIMDPTYCTNSVEIENINQDSNSKSSGYSSGIGNDSDSASDSDSDILSDSEDEMMSKSKREQAVRERKGMLKNLMADLHSDSIFKCMVSTTPKALVQQNRKPTRRSLPGGFYASRSLPPVTRRRSKLGDPNYCPEDEDEEDATPRSRLRVRFGPKRKCSSGSDEEPCSSPRKRTNSRRSSMAQEHIIIPVEDVTEEMLANIAKHSVGKEYNAINGSSCHQCRQKTMDTKSCCRDKNCVGVRGQFCGPCLQNRYGESVGDVLLDPDWSCPVCRGFCNCSICRNREGKCATGILIGLAKYHGFTNVKDYLAGLKSEKNFIAED